MAKKIARKRGAVAESKAVAAKLSPRDKKTMGSIEGLADGVVSAAEKRRDPYVDIPSRTLANVHYSPRKRILEMGKSTNRRQLFDLSQAKAYMQTMLVASGCKQLIDPRQDDELARSVLHAQAHDRRHEGKHVRRSERVRHDHRRRRSAARRACAKSCTCTPTNAARWSATSSLSTAATKSIARGWARAATRSRRSSSRR